MKKPEFDLKNWSARKIISFLLVVILILNLVFVFIINYSLYIFWGIILFAFIALQILKRTKKQA